MGAPETITQANLSMFGFASKNDRPFVRALSFIGFLDASNKPTEVYKNFRLKEKSKSTMAAALQSSYSELFAIYPDAHQQTTDSLQDFFKSKTDVGEAVVSMQVSTFKALCEFADFGLQGRVTAVPSEVIATALHPDVGQTVSSATQTKFGIDMPVTINVTVDVKDPEGIKALVKLVKAVRGEDDSEPKNTT